MTHDDVFCDDISYAVQSLNHRCAALPRKFRSSAIVGFYGGRYFIESDLKMAVTSWIESICLILYLP